MADRLGDEEVRLALAEDRADDDVTTQLLGPRADAPAAGAFLFEEDGVVAGLPVVAEVFRQLGVSDPLEHLVEEGAVVQGGSLVARVRGPARVLLAGERTALNFLQRLSGVATATRRAVDAVSGTGTGCVITDTRKTTPGLRALEKYAVRVGGGENHRMSLADRILWKDNHWELLGDARLADLFPRGDPGVVEVETDEQFDAALAAGARRLLADNVPPERVAEWVRRAGPDVSIQASGGITAETARAYAEAGARYISIGALTHSVPAVSIRFDLTLS